MGAIGYDGAAGTVIVDDRVLAHLQIVIGLKLRRQEGFLFTWSDDVSDGPGRNTIWLHPVIPLSFTFSGAHVPSVNLNWINALMHSANSAFGLELVPEPAPHGHP